MFLARKLSRHGSLRTQPAARFMLALVCAAASSVALPVAAAHADPTELCSTAIDPGQGELKITLKLDFVPGDRDAADRRYWASNLDDWAQRIERGIESQAAGRNIVTPQGRKVIFDVQVATGGHADKDEFHLIRLHRAEGFRDYVEGIYVPGRRGAKPQKGDWSVSNRPDTASGWLHEAFHLVGLDDKYIQVGRNLRTGATFQDPDREILTDSDVGKPVSPDDYYAFLEAHGLTRQAFPLALTRIIAEPEPGEERSIMGNLDPGTTLTHDEGSWLDDHAVDLCLPALAPEPDDSGKHCYKIPHGTLQPSSYVPDPGIALARYEHPLVLISFCSFGREAKYLREMIAYLDSLLDAYRQASENAASVSWEENHDLYDKLQLTKEQAGRNAGAVDAEMTLRASFVEAWVGLRKPGYVPVAGQMRKFKKDFERLEHDVADENVEMRRVVLGL
jgi:hypothetical protein